MSFSLTLTEEQTATQKWAHEFAEREIRPVAAAYDESEEFPWPVVDKAREIGLYGLEYYQMAGSDESGLTSAIVSEELTWGCAGIGLAILGSGLALAGLAGSGTPEQFTTWAPRIFANDDGSTAVGAFAVTEPSAGSDVSSLRTRAERVAGGWRLHGTKVFITNGGIAGVHVVVATVDPALGHKGQATFLVPPGTPGLRQGRKERKLGIRASHTAEIVLEDCVVPDDCLLGGEDALARKMEAGRTGTSTRRSGALSTFEATRPFVAAQALGIARAAFEYSRDYAKERLAFGKPILSNQAIAFKLADMATEIDCARLLVWRAAWMGRAGVPFKQAEGSMSKLKAGEVAVWVTDQAIQILGGYGYIKDFPVEKWHRDSKIYTIFEGTSEIQRLVISRAVAAAT
ncbi:MAG TPA: acyl-CoA dehydrogenase family protein [Mycobacteriales bacterium]|jgi:alkylation response protein AidB-like acyl-CoA dehydrogenase|nr:acyl-CoA dehydrogenase family protein [Mycobacteriales bacterium]